MGWRLIFMPMAPWGAIFFIYGPSRGKRCLAPLHWPPCPALLRFFLTPCVRCATRATSARFRWARQLKNAGAWMLAFRAKCWLQCRWHNAGNAVSALPAPVQVPASPLQPARHQQGMFRLAKALRNDRLPCLHTRSAQCCATRVRRSAPFQAAPAFHCIFSFFVSLPPCANFWE